MNISIHQVKLPTLALFYFRLWRCFTSDFGAFLLPTLALFYFQLRLLHLMYTQEAKGYLKDAYKQTSDYRKYVFGEITHVWVKK